MNLNLRWLCEFKPGLEEQEPGHILSEYEIYLYLSGGSAKRKIFFRVI